MTNEYIVTLTLEEVKAAAFEYKSASNDLNLARIAKEKAEQDEKDAEILVDQTYIKYQRLSGAFFGLGSGI